MKRLEGIEFERYVAQYYVNKINSCRSRKIEFHLTLSQVRSFLKRKCCQLSGVELTHQTGTDRRFTDVTLDRIDSNGHYTMDNVVAAANGFNNLKSRFENPNGEAKFSHLIKFAKTIEKVGLK